MTAYPLLFSFRDLIAGNGFFAQVATTGRVLLVQEESGKDNGEWWLYGVQPGCIAGGDSERAAALTEFKKNYLSVLLDVAAEAESYEKFANEVKQLFAQVNEPTATEWAEALKLIRSGAVKYPGIICVKAAEEHQPTVDISPVTQRTATPNANPDLEPTYLKVA